MSILSSTQSFVEVLVKAKVYKVFTKQFLIIFYKRKYEENAKDVLFAKIAINECERERDISNVFLLLRLI